MITRAIIIILAFAAVLSLPYALRPAREIPPAGALPLVVISPHMEAIRYEFEQAFRQWHAARYGKPVVIDWRIVGGTSEIMRYIESEYVAAFKQHWTATLGEPWTSEVAAAFSNYRLDAPGAKVTDLQKKAREAFLASSAGIGIDVIFGGGSFDNDRNARKGYLVDCGLSRMHPEWLAPEIIPQTLGGEVYYDKQGRWYGACLTTFGICYNRESLRRLKIDKPPTQWSDLADPKYYKQIGLADPTKSGSINKAYEMLLQQQIGLEIGERKARTASWDDAAEKEAIAAGFARGMRILQRIAANARYFTDGASSVVGDVGDGNAAAGMCIDFYGRVEAESIWQRGSDRLEYVAPAGGTTVSVDPIGIFRGAPNFEVAQHFVEFVISPEGQKLWNYKAGTPGGPVKYSLRRMPIRQDLYTAEHQRFMSDPNAEPYTIARQMVYHPEWTASLFNFLRLYFQSMAMDPHGELQEAWRAIIEAGGPDAVPEAAAVMGQMAVPYEKAAEQNINDPIQRMALTRNWSMSFKKQYEEVRKLARAQRKAASND